MKMKLTKLIALLVSMAMLTSLVACAADDGEEQTDDNDTSNADKYKNLSPEKVYAALLEAEEVRVTVNSLHQCDDCYGESTGESTYVTERDGNKAKESYSDSDGYGGIEYYDFDNGRNYIYYEERGEWSVNFSGNNQWEYLIEPDRLVDWSTSLLWEDNNYRKEGDRYVVTDEAIDRYIRGIEIEIFGSGETDGYSIEPRVEAYMDVEENKYIYVLNTDGLEEGETENFKITVEFTDTTVEFPDFGIEIEQDDEGLVYELNDSGTYTVVDIGGTDKTDLVIPSTYKGKAVTAIGDEAFRAAQITSITIPDSVTSIGEMAFYYCTLTSVTIPDSINRIDWEAFKCCDNLTSIVFENPEGWTADGESIDLSDPAQAAKYLTETYVGSSFERS